MPDNVTQQFCRKLLRDGWKGTPLLIAASIGLLHCCNIVGIGPADYEIFM
jgi:hypothetical protein